MNKKDVIAVLNELLALEQRRVLMRLEESTAFVSDMDMEMELHVRRMADECRENCARLVTTILSLGGAPAPRMGDVRSADLHFQELHHVLPRLLADQENLIASYRKAAARVSVEGKAAGVVGEILARHQKDLEQLKALVEKRAA